MNNIERASLLSEALPYIRAYNKKVVVIKYNSKAMQTLKLKKAAISDIVLLSLVGVRVVVVHGCKDGDDASLDATGKEIVSLITSEGAKAFSFSGLDASLFTAEKNEIVSVNPELVTVALDNGYIPVISAIARSVDSETNHSIYAATAAMELAVSLGAEKLILLTDCIGVQNKDSQLISELPLSKVRQFIKEGIISGDMIHRVDCCVKAVRKGVPRAHILDGRVSHSILVEMLTDSGIGTMILHD